MQFNGTLNVGYDLSYTYGTESGKKFQLASVKDVNYRTEETPGDNNIENNHVYLYDKNGNLVYVNTGRMMNDGHNEVGTRERKLIWDEENRLLAVDDNGFVSNSGMMPTVSAQSRLPARATRFTLMAYSLEALPTPQSSRSMSACILSPIRAAVTPSISTQAVSGF